MSKPKYIAGKNVEPIDVTNDALMVEEGLRVPLKDNYVREQLSQKDKDALKQAKLSYKSAFRTKNPKLKQLSNEMLGIIVNTKKVHMNLTLKPMNYN